MYIQSLGTARPLTLPRDKVGMPAWLSLLLATACGLIAANIYYAQPLVSPVSVALHLSPRAAGLIATMAQIGYGVGLLLVVPLCDLFENRRLVFLMLCVAVLALLGAAVSTSAAPFLASAALIGLGSVAVQILVPYAAHLAPDAARGRVVGNVMSGLMLGIMLARPAASLVTEALSWRAVFVISSTLMAGLAVVLWVALPPRQPAPGLSYQLVAGFDGKWRGCHAGVEMTRERSSDLRPGAVICPIRALFAHEIGKQDRDAQRRNEISLMAGSG